MDFLAGLVERSLLWFPLLHDFGASAAFQRPRWPMWGGLWSTNSAQGLLEETWVTVISHKIILLNATRHRLWTTMYFDECLAISGAAWGSTSICQCKEYDIKSYKISYSFSFHASIMDNSIKDYTFICTCRFKLDLFIGNHTAFTQCAWDWWILIFTVYKSIHMLSQIYNTKDMLAYR